MKSSRRLFLIDGNAYCYRAFYAVGRLATSRGEPTGAVFGFISILQKILQRDKPDGLAVAFDMEGPTFRHVAYEAYKAHRAPMPDELVSQLPVIREVLAAFHIPIFEKQGYEADDVLATVALQAAQKGYQVFIVTGDKDILQMVDDRIRVYDPHKDDGLVYDAQKVRERFGGLGPDKVVEIMALAGDSSDNIPGVPGIGEKTAVELIREFGSVDTLLRQVEKVKGEKRRQALQEHAATARLSRTLAEIDRRVPVEIVWDELAVREPDPQALIKLYERLEFRSLLKGLAAPGASREREAHDYKIVRTAAELQRLASSLKSQKTFAVDTETTSIFPMQAKLVGISFSWLPRQGFYVPVNLPDCADLSCEAVLDALREVLEDARIGKVGQHIKYDAIVLAEHGVTLQGIVFDTMLAAYLLDPGRRTFALDDLSLSYLQYRKITTEEVLKGTGKKPLTMDQVPVERVAEYACEDADITWRLQELLAPKLAESQLVPLFETIERPLIDVLIAMERAGVAVDLKQLDDLRQRFQKSLSRLTDRIYREAECEFNINSPIQLREVLFERLKLPVIKKTKTGPSTDVEVLEKLKIHHRLPGLLLEYRELFKLQSTYVETLPQLVHPRTGRIHTSYHQAGTATGRLSSSDPNLQNIPVKSELGRKIREAFVPQKPRWVLMSADYSQIELRILAHLSQDAVLLKAFNDGADIHTYTAALIYGVPEVDVQPAMRTAAKTVNFGVLYGMSPFGLSQTLEIPVEQADEFIKAYFARYPQVRQYLDRTVTMARKDGFVQTVWGRRRQIPEIHSANAAIRNFAERTATNAPIQGSAADLIKLAMIAIHAELNRLGLSTKMIMQVHDELVFEVPKQEVDTVTELVRRKMTQVAELNVPIEVHIGAGANWLEASQK